MSIHEEQLVDAFSDTVGREKAKETISSVTTGMDLDGESTYDEDEAIEITRQVANQADATPFVRTAAQTVQTRIQANHL